MERAEVRRKYVPLPIELREKIYGNFVQQRTNETCSPVPLCKNMDKKLESI